jgi:Chaperone of endosialidase
MNALRTRSLVLIPALVAIVQPVFAVPPPNVVDSDGNGNTAMGTDALASLTDGFSNTAAGSEALGSNTTGSANTAFGSLALNSNTSGANNTAVGRQALLLNDTGNANVAIGVDALFGNTTGGSNTAIGFGTLNLNTSGTANTATGFLALVSNATGIRNVGIGYNALRDNVTGRNNTAIGWAAGQRTTGNDNVLIAHRGALDESQTMRIGTRGTEGVAGSGVTRTFIAGIRNVTTSRLGIPVLIDSAGQLGTISSSRRFKQDIEAMADASDRLLQLRPVRFYYTEADALGERPVQYGLIAEEVAEAFPELVILDEDGQPETVAYHMLPALLLNELQKEHALNQAQSEKLETQEKQLAEQSLQLTEMRLLKEQLAAVEKLVASLQLSSKDVQLAMQ